MSFWGQGGTYLSTVAEKGRTQACVTDRGLCPLVEEDWSSFSGHGASVECWVCLKLGFPSRGQGLLGGDGRGGRSEKTARRSCNWGSASGMPGDEQDTADRDIFLFLSNRLMKLALGNSPAQAS